VPYREHLVPVPIHQTLAEPLDAMQSEAKSRKPGREEDRPRKGRNEYSRDNSSPRYRRSVLMYDLNARDAILAEDVAMMRGRE